MICDMCGDNCKDNCGKNCLLMLLYELSMSNQYVQYTHILALPEQVALRELNIIRTCSQERKWCRKLFLYIYHLPSWNTLDCNFAHVFRRLMITDALSALESRIDIFLMPPSVTKKNNNRVIRDKRGFHKLLPVCNHIVIKG